jgi:hypothetical protein
MRLHGLIGGALVRVEQLGLRVAKPTIVAREFLVL